MALTSDKWFVLAVALLTWGGVFGYLLRLDKLAKTLAEEVRARSVEDEQPSASAAPISLP